MAGGLPLVEKLRDYTDSSVVVVLRGRREWQSEKGMTR